jgi:hypothetical protein
MTFARACDHLVNYTSGHESRSSFAGDDRFAYPEAHIESDNRLSWMLGDLARRFEPAPTMYVHLVRDRERVAASYLRRWEPVSPNGIIGAFSNAIVMRSKEWPEGERLDLCRFYVDTVNANISEFLRHQARTARVRLESASTDYSAVLEQIGALGDLDAAVREWNTAHNASTR